MLLISVSIQDVVDLVTDAAWRFTVVALGVLAILIVLSAIVSRYISQPIAQMTEAIAQMGKGNLNVRTRARGNSEIAQMARTFDDMSGKLANAERQRQEFVANASHELKTPLSSIKILTESLLYRENVPEETYREFLSDINQQIDRLNTLLDDLLVLAQSERGDVVMHYTNESLNSLLDDCVKTLMPLAREKDISIYLPEEKVRIRCDRLKLNTALLNLLSNGIKYTPRGGSVGVSAHADGQWVTIRVWDTGVGIPEEDRAHIFERFYRVDKGTLAQHRGYGPGPGHRAADHAPARGRDLFRRCTRPRNGFRCPAAARGGGRMKKGNTVVCMPAHSGSMRLPGGGGIRHGIQAHAADQSVQRG